MPKMSKNGEVSVRARIFEPPRGLVDSIFMHNRDIDLISSSEYSDYFDGII